MPALEAVRQCSGGAFSRTDTTEPDFWQSKSLAWLRTKAAVLVEAVPFICASVVSYGSPDRKMLLVEEVLLLLAYFITSLKVILSSKSQD